MGWDFTMHPASRDAIKDTFLHTWLDGNDTVSITDAMWVGTHLWGVFRKNGTPTCIVLWLVNRRTTSWGYKSMSEDMGPYAVDCPLRLLSLVPVSDNSYAKNWRDKVYAYHADKRAKTKTKAALKIDVGCSVRLIDKLRVGTIPVGGKVGQVIMFGRRNMPIVNIEGFRLRVPRTYIAEVVSGFDTGS